MVLEVSRIQIQHVRRNYLVDSKIYKFCKYFELIESYNFFSSFWFEYVPLVDKYENCRIRAKRIAFLII